MFWEQQTGQLQLGLSAAHAAQGCAACVALIRRGREGAAQIPLQRMRGAVLRGRRGVLGAAARRGAAGRPVWLPEQAAPARLLAFLEGRPATIDALVEHVDTTSIAEVLPMSPCAHLPCIPIKSTWTPRPSQRCCTCHLRTAPVHRMQKHVDTMSIAEVIY